MVVAVQAGRLSAAVFISLLSTGLTHAITKHLKAKSLNHQGKETGTKNGTEFSNDTHDGHTNVRGAASEEEIGIDGVTWNRAESTIAWQMTMTIYNGHHTPQPISRT